MSFMNQLGFQRVYNFIFSSEWSGVRYKIPITAGMMSKSNFKKIKNKKKSSTYICVIRSRCRMDFFFYYYYYYYSIFRFLRVIISKICKTTGK